MNNKYYLNCLVAGDGMAESGWDSSYQRAGGSVSSDDHNPSRAGEDCTGKII